jgi:DNA-binding response OmpR family regulator
MAADAVLLLNVDDNPASRAAVSGILRQADFSALEAATGQVALHLAARSPALIILGVRLPALCGLDVCRRLKSGPATILQDSAGGYRLRALGARRPAAAR